MISFSITIKAQSEDLIDKYENIEVTEDKKLILSPAQFVQLANYIEQLKAENKSLKSKLDQANEELEKAYSEKDNSIDLTQFSNVLTGAGIATILIILAGNIQ